MLKMLESPDDVLAAEVAGKITGGDLDVIMDRLDADSPCRRPGPSRSLRLARLTNIAAARHEKARKAWRARALVG